MGWADEFSSRPDPLKVRLETFLCLLVELGLNLGWINKRNSCRSSFHVFLSLALPTPWFKLFYDCGFSFFFLFFFWVPVNKDGEGVGAEGQIYEYARVRL